jgi:hypothetical protein
LHADHFPYLSFVFFSSFDLLNIFTAFASFVYNGIRFFYQSAKSLSTFAAVLEFPAFVLFPLPELFPGFDAVLLLFVVDPEVDEFEDVELELVVLEFFGAVVFVLDDVLLVEAEVFPEIDDALAVKLDVVELVLEEVFPVVLLAVELVVPVVPVVPLVALVVVVVFAEVVLVEVVFVVAVELVAWR